MSRHMNTVHLKLKRFQCDLCDKTFTTKINMAQHVLKCESIKEKDENDENDFNVTCTLSLNHFCSIYTKSIHLFQFQAIKIHAY